FASALPFGSGAAIVPANVAVFIDVQPGGLLHGSFSNTPDLVAASMPADAGDGPMSFDYANPFDGGFEPFAVVSASYGVFVRAPLPDGGQGTQAAVTGLVTSLDTLAHATAGPVRPLLSAPRLIQVNCTNSTSVLKGVGVTPSISWVIPATG